MFELAGRINVSISGSDIRDIQSADARNQIGGVASRAWDKIVDWFCGTKREEAKKCLFDLYSKETTPLKKHESFFRLKELAGHGFQDRFTEERTKAGTMLKADFGEEPSEKYKLQVDICSIGYLNAALAHEAAKKVDKAKDKDVSNSNLGLDLPRADYYINGEQIIDILPTESNAEYGPSLEKFKIHCETLKPTDIQEKAIAALAHQALWTFVMDSALSSNGGIHKDHSDYMHFNNKGSDDSELGSIYKLEKDGGNIKLHATFNGCWQNAEGILPRTSLAREPMMSIDITISPTGEVTVDAVNYLSHKLDVPLSYSY